MMRLNLPPYTARVKEADGRRQIFDILRRKYVTLTPEEWVRQHFIHYLIDYKGYPAALLANEVPLQVGEKRVRADSVLYDRQLRPRLIIEYKAPTIPLTCRLSHRFERIGNLYLQDGLYKPYVSIFGDDTRL